jgi:hypothetical protein
MKKYRKGTYFLKISTIHIHSVSGGILNTLGDGSMDCSE